MVRPENIAFTTKSEIGIEILVWLHHDETGKFENLFQSNVGKAEDEIRKNPGKLDKQTIKYNF